MQVGDIVRRKAFGYTGDLYVVIQVIHANKSIGLKQARIRLLSVPDLKERGWSIMSNYEKLPR